VNSGVPSSITCAKVKNKLASRSPSPSPSPNPCLIAKVADNIEDLVRSHEYIECSHQYPSLTISKAYRVRPLAPFVDQRV